tara:strand:+ start:2023 stop:2499 length:477 start_codon:yes stop_codon:yes gene_type:complete
MPKRTKEQALERLMDVPDAPGLKGKLGAVNRAARLGAAGLIMLDPLNRLADEVTVVPYDMIAIPAHEYFRLNSDPTFQIYIRGGETIMPTGGNVRDVQEVVETVAVEDTPKPRKKTTAYQRKYKKAFAKVKPKHMAKNGKWKKGGFKAAVKAAHRMCK